MVKILDKLLSSKNNKVNIKSKISLKGKKILQQNIKEIDKYLNNNDF